MSAIEPVHRQATLPERPLQRPGYFSRVFGRDHRQQLGRASKFEPVSLKMGKVDDWSQQVRANYPRPTASSADGYVVKQLKLAVENVRADFTADTVTTQAAFGDSYEPLRAKWAAARDLVQSHEDAKWMQARRTSSSGISQTRRNSPSYKLAAGQQGIQDAITLNQQIIQDRHECNRLVKAVNDAYPHGPTPSSADGYAVKQLAAAVQRFFAESRKSNSSLWLSASALVKKHQDARQRTQYTGPARWEELQDPFNDPFVD